MGALGVLLIILKIVGIVLLVILALLLLILLVPIRYRLRMIIQDPVPSEEQPDYLSVLQEQGEYSFRFSWFYPLVKGGIRWPEEPSLSVRILFWKIDPVALAMRLLHSSGKGEDSSEKKEKKSGGAGGFPEKIQNLWRKIRSLIRLIRSLLRLMDRRFSHRALARLKQVLGDTMPRLLPRRWFLKGSVGLGDPQAGGRIYEAIGLLWPWVDGHVDLQVEMMTWQLDLAGEAEGKIRLGTLLAAALRLVLDKDVRRLIHGLRRWNRQAGKPGSGQKSSH